MYDKSIEPPCPLVCRVLNVLEVAFRNADVIPILNYDQLE